MELFLASIGFFFYRFSVDFVTPSKQAPFPRAIALNEWKMKKVMVKILAYLDCYTLNSARPNHPRMLHSAL
jgi:hypothetical protein